jgi:cytochrome b subunit of formate dehydrogenase
MLHEEIKNIKADKKELRKFGLTVGAVLLIISGFLFWKQRAAFTYFAVSGGALIVFGLLAPTALKPLFRVWMSFAVIMGFIMTRVILTVIYFFLFTPIALVLKLLGKDLLEERWDKTATSYWIKRKPEPFDPAAVERMF